MSKNIFKSILNLKFIFFNIAIFISVSLLTKATLVQFDKDFINILDSILYTFNLTEDIGLSIDALKVLTIYIVIIYISIDYLYTYINKFKYLSILRVQSIKKYIYTLFIHVYTLIFIYFFIGYIIIAIINSNFNLDFTSGFYNLIYNDTNYIYSILYNLLLNNSIVITIINLTLILFICVKNFKLSFIYSLSIFIIGSLGINKYIPGFFIYFYRNISINGTLMSGNLFISILSSFITLVIAIYLLRKNREFLLFDFDL
ncbi:MAG: hypothetical protein ACRC3Y_12320 [Romboutsia sp.]|uniref:hypothetical protein n=1 Tax=Romboutsia sp. TaxID=1965302 RepID=UPI003F38E277